MSKCVSCQAELPTQSRFCGACGTTQPSETTIGEPENIETVRSNPPAENPPANIPPPPPQPQQNIGGIEKRDIAPPSQEEQKPPSGSSPEQFLNPPSGPHPQPQVLQSEQPQSQPLQQPYGQPAPQPFYGSNPYGPQSQPLYGSYQPPYGNYPPPPQPQQPYGQYPQPQQPYSNYPPTPAYGDYPQAPSPGIYTANTVASSDAGIMPVPPTTGPGSGPQPTPITGPGPLPTPTTGPQLIIGSGLQPTPITTPESKAKRPAWLIWVIVAAVVIVILAGTGIGFVLASKPALSPTITVTSKYYDKGTLAGATDTQLQVTGKQFATNSAITFLLDNTVIRQDMQAVSNSSGNFTTDLTVTSAWSVGPHKITAHDASNNTTKDSTSISIVQQGYNNTPGPNGAPTNTAKFTITTTTHLQSGSTVYSYNPALQITPQSDDQGGSVCSPGDNGSQQKDQFDGPNGSTVYEVYTTTCSGTYKGGHVTYNDTLDTDVYTDADGTCTLMDSQPSWIQLVGDYTTSEQFSGTITINSISGGQYTCSGDLIKNTSSGSTGNWTGTVSQ